jgi:hypothetical protein
VDDVERLADRNLRFIEAWRQGSWPMLEPIVSRSFCYLDGATGEAWNMECYIKELTKHPDSALVIDQVVILVDGDTAVVSARSASPTRPGQAHRYIDTYARSGDDWLCIHACVWPLLPPLQVLAPRGRLDSRRTAVTR